VADHIGQELMTRQNKIEHLEALQQKFAAECTEKEKENTILQKQVELGCFVEISTQNLTCPKDGTAEERVGRSPGRSHRIP
jgi:hypothetical protein